MRIFLTGGSGYVGSAVLDAFVRAGHQVDALVRNSEKAAVVQARGGHPLLGDLSDPATYAGAAAAADGVVHTAFEYSARGAQVDAAALGALLTPSRNRARFAIYTSGVWVLGNCATPTDESAALNPIALVAWRPAHEQRVLALRDRRNPAHRDSARSRVRRLPRDGGGHLQGCGEQSRPRDRPRRQSLAARLRPRSRGALRARRDESGRSGVFHANDEGDERVNDLVAAIASHAKTSPSIRHVPLAEARQKMGPYADALALDQIVRSPRARAIGWNPSLHSVAGNAARLSEEWRRGKEAAA